MGICSSRLEPEHATFIYYFGINFLFFQLEICQIIYIIRQVFTFFIFIIQWKIIQPLSSAKKKWYLKMGQWIKRKDKEYRQEEVSLMVELEDFLEVNLHTNIKYI